MGDNTLDIGAGSHILAARLHRRLRSLQRAAQALAQRALLILPRGAGWAERRGAVQSETPTRAWNALGLLPE